MTHVYDTKTQKRGYDTNAVMLLGISLDGVVLFLAWSKFLFYEGKLSEPIQNYHQMIHIYHQICLMMDKTHFHTNHG